MEQAWRAANDQGRAKKQIESGGRPNNSYGLSLLVDKEIHFPGEAPSLLSHEGSTGVRWATSELPQPPKQL